MNQFLTTLLLLTIAFHATDAHEIPQRSLLRGAASSAQAQMNHRNRKAMEERGPSASEDENCEGEGCDEEEFFSEDSPDEGYEDFSEDSPDEGYEDYSEDGIDLGPEEGEEDMEDFTFEDIENNKKTANDATDGEMMSPQEFEEFMEKQFEEQNQKEAMGASAAEVAKAVIFLSSEHATKITGHIMRVDGGKALTSRGQ